MSYDFSIEVDTGGQEPHSIEPYFSDVLPGLDGDGMAGTAAVTDSGYARCGNYTSNVSGMWSDCLSAVAGRKVSLRDFHGKSCGLIAPLFSAAVEWGLEHLDELREQNPENGWGNAEGAVTYLWDIQRACEQHPKGKLAIHA